ncbi:MAG: ribonuclease G [Ignavibacteria bacterium]|nr:ribonuclease G [Ignavibacteria bacterium]MBT8382746.1 ribonuclease G [Ignavibacteria bacterium]MBT8392955.1 ribonuclease G [Ignavibacteria bacterium]NNJ53890.1 ribonuclease G [Ignavibacteriaceae bacterium]NNL19742.1 ribonuclease G [Ignavibacteriaceae bacterium]
MQSSNNSGKGKTVKLPSELSGWNWGAFFLSWIWGIGNNTWIALLTFVPFVNFVMIFILGAKGNEWAWQNKRWDSFDHFIKVQKLWAIWGLVLFLISILFVFFVIIATLSVADAYDY